MTRTVGLACSTAFAAACVALSAGSAAADDQTPAGAAPAAAPAAPAAPAPTPMPYPSMSALAANPNPANFDAGPLGKVTVDGVLTGLAFGQTNSAFDFNGKLNDNVYGDVSNAQIIINKSSGAIQFYIQAGAYSLPDLGAPYYGAYRATEDFYGPVPQGFIKIAPNASFSIEAGALPTLQGAEYTFSFENMNIERGLLWNQENAVNKGVQINYTKGPWTVSAAWTDGYDSDRYNSVSGLITYTFKNTDTLTFVGQGEVGDVRVNTLLTPGAQANSQLFNLIYSHTQGKWTISPYIQYTNVPEISGVTPSGSTIGGALLVKYAFTSTVSVSARGEYISSSGAANLIYGPGSDAWSLTLTPTYQKGIFFARVEASYVGVTNATPGFAFGSDGNAKSQFRGLVEGGVIF